MDNVWKHVAKIKHGLLYRFGSCVVIGVDQSCASETYRPVSAWAGWISVKQTVCTSLRACEIIYFWAVLLSNCQCLLFPVKRRSLSARLFFNTAGFNISKLVQLLGLLVADSGCTRDSFHLCVAHGTNWEELLGGTFGSFWLRVLICIGISPVSVRHLFN